jgi:hypothetical protein
MRVGTHDDIARACPVFSHTLMTHAFANIAEGHSLLAGKFTQKDVVIGQFLLRAWSRMVYVDYSLVRVLGGLDAKFVKLAQRQRPGAILDKNQVYRHNNESAGTGFDTCFGGQNLFG